MCQPVCIESLRNMILEAAARAAYMVAAVCALMLACSSGVTLDHLQSWGTIGTVLVVETPEGAEIEVPAEVSVIYIEVGEDDDPGVACVHVDESSLGTGVIMPISHDRCAEVLPPFEFGLRLTAPLRGEQSNEPQPQPREPFE